MSQSHESDLSAPVFVPSGPVPASSSDVVDSIKGDEDVEMKDDTISASRELVTRVSYVTYDSADDISYVPEDALKEGVGMVKELKANIDRLELGSKLRKDVWLREIERQVDVCRSTILC